MALAKYPRLKRGDTVALAVPAGPVDEARLHGAVRLLEGYGFTVALRDDAGTKTGFLAGSDERRRAELQGALDDPCISAVILARGGYGVQRIAPHLTKPARLKPLVGFSDNTALHGLVNGRWRGCSIHGPHPNAECASEFDEVVACLTEGARPAFSGLTALRTGAEVEGRLLGGCLALLSSSVGTLCLPSFAGAVVFIEDVAEPPYKLDRMLNHLLLSGAFRKAVGVVFGRPESFTSAGCDPNETLAVLADFAQRLEIPVLHGLPCGHTTDNRPLLFGTRVRLEPEAGTLNHLESITK